MAALLGTGPALSHAAGLPDLKATYQGTEIANGVKYAKFDILNDGDSKANASRAKGVRTNELNHPEFFDIDSISPGKVKTVKVSYGSQTCGSFHIKLTVDIDADVTESNEGNNVIDVPAEPCQIALNPGVNVVGAAPKLPDLAVTQEYLQVLPDRLVFHYKVKNIGSGEAKNVDVVGGTTVLDGGESIGTKFYGLAPASTLAAGASFAAKVECPMGGGKLCQSAYVSAATQGDPNLKNNSASWPE